MSQNTKGLWIGVATIIILATAWVFGSYLQPVDVVNHIKPVSNDLKNYASMTELRKMTPQERGNWMKSPQGKIFQEKLVQNLEIFHKVKPAEIASLNFYFGSLTNVEGKDGDGKTHTGYFRDQLIAEVVMRNGTTEKFFVICLNGYVTKPGELEKLEQTAKVEYQLASYNSPSGTTSPEPQWLTVNNGEGVCDNITVEDAINLAEKYNRRLTIVRNGKRQTVTPAEARLLKNQERIYILVQPGDKFTTSDFQENIY